MSSPRGSSATRLVIAGRRHHADRIVEGLEPAKRRQLVRQFDVLRNALAVLMLPVARHAARLPAEELGGYHEQILHVDHRPPLGTMVTMGRRGSPIGEQPVDRALRFLIAGRTDLDVRLNQGEAVVYRFQ